MMDKYYTPEIEEFHPGFEFESYNNLDWYHKKDTSGWNKIVYDKIAYMKHPIDQIKAALGRKWARVKYLDKEDIESFGFELAWNEWNEHTYTNAELMLQFNPSGHVYRLYVASEIRFKGIIKNKSELKRILKQIGYE